MTSRRAISIVATLSLVALLLALALPVAADLSFALVPTLPALALLECAGATSPPPEAAAVGGWATAPGARGPPSAG